MNEILKTGDSPTEVKTNLNQALKLGNKPEVGLAKTLELAKVIAKSGLTSYKRAEEIAAIGFYAKELKVGLMTALNNMHYIEGKVGVGIHIITSKLLENNIMYKVLKDYEPVYSYGNIRTKDIITEEEFLNLKKENKAVAVAFSGDEAKKAAQKSEYITMFPDKEIYMKIFTDTITVIEFTRYFTIVGKVIEQKHIEKLAWSEVPDSLKTKSNWKNYPKLMLRNRPLASGSRFIASDLLHGVYDETELLESSGVDYITDETGRVISVNNEPRKEFKVEEIKIMEDVVQGVVDVETLQENQQTSSDVVDMPTITEE